MLLLFQYFYIPLQMTKYYSVVLESMSYNDDSSKPQNKCYINYTVDMFCTDKSISLIQPSPPQESIVLTYNIIKIHSMNKSS